jgi:hypothetical protein
MSAVRWVLTGEREAGRGVVAFAFTRPEKEDSQSSGGRQRLGVGGGVRVRVAHKSRADSPRWCLAIRRARPSLGLSVFLVGPSLWKSRGSKYYRTKSIFPHLTFTKVHFYSLNFKTTNHLSLNFSNHVFYFSKAVLKAILL